MKRKTTPSADRLVILEAECRRRHSILSDAEYQYFLAVRAYETEKKRRAHELVAKQG